MPSRRKLDLEEVKASLSTLCPQCGDAIAPAELRRVDFERVRCPKLQTGIHSGQAEMLTNT